MAIPSDQGLLVVNLENCISNTDAEHVVKDECLYTVAVTPSACGENDGVIRIPVSVHCGERVQQSYTAEAQLGEQQQLTSPPSHFSDVHAQHYTRLEVGQSLQCLNNDVGSGSSQQEEAHAECFPMRIDQEQSNDTDSSYYTEIYNYLTTQSMPEGASDSYKKILKKRAYNYKIIDDVLFYGQKLPKKVIAEREQQREILRSVHIEESTGVHLGLKKMYMGISRYYFWKRLYVDVANFVRQCKQCSETADIQSNANEVQKEQQTENSDNPVEDKTAGNGSTSKVWQKVELKLFGPYPRTVLHNEFIITIADPFSHWLVARPISDSNDANHIADFVYKTFCTFGFAKCSVVDIPQEVLEMIQSKYEECISRLRDTLLTCGLMVPHLVSSCSTAVSSLHPLISENLSQCSWVGKLLNDFVEANHSSWDLELERFLFECCTTSNAESPSPFTIMFGRSPVSCLEEEDKENRVGKEKPVEVLSKRRRLQSSILQCRHCEDVFTSKISFRIHQRKHTEEARRQGILEGQEPHESVTEREKKLLKRTIMKRRQKLLKQGNTDHRERLVMIANQKLHPGQESLPKDKRRAELQASTVAAVKKLLASTKEERRRRGRYHKYSAELQEEMARYATEHGNLETVRHFSQRMGTTVSESTVRNIVKLYRAFTPGLKEEIGRFAVRFGVEMACSHFTERLGQQVRRGLVRKFKKLYLSHHPDVEDKNKDFAHPPDNCPNETASVEDSLYSDKEVTNSPSNVSDTGGLSLASDSITDASPRTSTSLHSRRITYNETSPKMGTEICTLDKTQETTEKQVQENDRELRQVNDINVVVYRETEMPDELKNGNNVPAEGYMPEMNQVDFSAIQLEVVKYPLQTRNETFCGEKFGHVTHNSVISSQVTTDGLFYCDICSKSFANKKILTSHIEQHSNIVLKCTQCTYTTKSSKLLEYHQNIHSEKFKCKFCSKVFTRKIYLKYHIKDIHQNTRCLHNCEECCAKFMSISGLKMHIRTVHEPSRTYSCTVCSYVGHSANSLASHTLRNHRKKYKCSICDYSSSTQGGLDKHLKIYHNPENRTFACKHCSYCGLKRRQLLDHERTVHSQDTNKHICPVCKRSFRTHVLMKHHLPSHSDRHLYSCRGCSYTTRYRQTFHSHLKHSHPGESFKNLCVGPTDADFEAIINTALGKLESLPTYIEQNVEINYAAQISEERAVIEASDHFFEGTVLSEHSSPYQETSNCLEDDGTSRLPPLPEYETSQGRCSITRNDLESTVITEEVTNSVLELNAGNVDSDQTVTVIDGSGLTNDEVQTIVSLAGDLNASKQDVHHLVTFSDATKKTIFPLSGFSTREDKIHQVVTLVDGLDTVSEIDQHTVALINNISHDKVADCSTVTHISLTGISKSNQENFVILPLEDSKVAVIQRDIHTDNHLVLDDQTALLDLVPHQTEFVQQQAEENVNQITVYHLNQ